MKTSGFLLIDKPVDWTSHDVVGYLRRVTGIKKIGHAGTLDPFATGILIVGVGREATKRLDEFKGMKKEYIATLKFGATSDTQDLTGTITTVSSDTQQIKKVDIEHVLQTFIGEQQQIPPMYSAKKIKGKKLYELARSGVTIDRTPHNIYIYSIERISPYHGVQRLWKKESPNECTIRVVCSTGTYIRTLCHDIGEALKIGAYCKTLRRINIGEYTVKKAISPKKVHAHTWNRRLYS
jgi:tRNA pseudouridine55 synthase